MSHRWKHVIQDESRIWIDQGVRQHRPSDILHHRPLRACRERLSDPLFGGLVCCGTGAFQKSAYHFVDRPKGFPHHTLQWVSHGEGWYERPPRPRQTIHAPALVWISGKEPHRYGSHERNPWTVWHVAGLGPTMDLFHRRILSTPGDFRVSLTFTEKTRDRIRDGFLQIQKSFLNTDPQHGPLQQSLMLRSFLQDLLALVEGERSAAGRDFADLKEHLAAQLSEHIPLTRLAQSFGMGPRAFSLLVKGAFGEGPLAYRNRLRLESARVFLAGGATVTEAARKVGFQDGLYFSRLFRDRFGHPPRLERVKRVESPPA